MSTYSSVCHDKTHEDKIDVASCYVCDMVRIVVFEDIDGVSSTSLLSVDEAEHLIDLITQCIKRIRS